MTLGIHGNICLPSVLTTLFEGGGTFIGRSIKDWNTLEKALKNSKDTKSFKTRLKNTVLERKKN